MPTEWHRFEEVTTHIPRGSHRLYRASAPNYAGFDGSQRLTQSAVDHLATHGITRIISLNMVEYTDEEKTRLNLAGVAYLHLPVEDFTAPTLEQIRRAITMFSKEPVANTLVHCGYGHGRTGTMVTAIQLWQTKGHLDLAGMQEANHVERDVQRDVLRAYQQELRKQEL